MDHILFIPFKTARPNVSVVHYGTVDDTVVAELKARELHGIAAKPPSLGGKAPDDYYREKQLQHLLLLTISSVTDVVEVVKGSSRLMKYARLDWLWVPEACYLPGILPQDVAELLHQNFVRVSMTGAGLQLTGLFDPLSPDGNILINRRMVTLLYPAEMRLQQGSILDEVMEGFKVQPTGVVHVGANYGQEIGYYRKKRYSPVVLIEANPDLAAHLAQLTLNDSDYFAVNVAATDKDGPVTLNITGNDQGSSLMPPTPDAIAEFGEAFHVERTVTVAGRRLDGLMAELKLPAQSFSLLHLDIQGAEAMALRGATGLLQHVQVVLSEINFMEHYEGCAQIEEVDDLLEAAGFTRVAIDCTYSASWGDGLYVRNSLLPV